MSPERHVERFRASVERVRALTALHVEEAKPHPRAESVRELSRSIADMERFLAATKEGARDTALGESLGLGPDALAFVWTVVALSTDPRLAEHAATLPFHARIHALTGDQAVALALVLGPAHPLVRHRIVIAHDERTPAVGTWQVPHRTAAYLAGDDGLDPDLLGAGERIAVPDRMLIDDRTRPQLERLDRAIGGGDVIAVLDGPVGAGRRTAVAVAARHLGRGAVALDLARVAPGTAALERALAALVREAQLTGAVPVVAGLDEVSIAAEDRTLLRLVARALDSVPGPSAVTTILAGADLGSHKPQLRIAFPVPPTSTRRTLWDRVLGDDAPEVGAADRDLLATRYRLGPGGVERAVAAARLVAAQRGDGLGTADLVAGVRNNVAERMGGLAARVAVRQTWDDLVLGAATLDQVRGLTARVKHAHLVLEQWGLEKQLARGSGVAALFSGPPGTGKTMVAGLIALELELELYQVDLARVESDRQLSRIFDAADAGHALVLFDDVQGDEVSYLLERVEGFGGLTILTTSTDASIDPMLVRRLAGHIRFGAPEKDERAALWKGVLTTAKVPLAGDLDMDALASRYPEMTGANIRNAAIGAAFLAAADGGAVSQAHLERASRGEYASMGRPVTP